MSDIKVNNLGTVLGPALQKKNGGQRVSLNQSPDTFQKALFNLDNAMEKLSSIKVVENGEEINKFDTSQLTNIKKELEKSPQKWDSIKTLADSPIVKSDTVELLSSRNKEIIDALVPFALEPSKNGNGSKYQSFELMRFALAAQNNGVENFVKAQPLIKTSLECDNINDIVAIPALRGKMDKVAAKVLDMEKAFGENLKKISFNQDVYNNKEYLIQAESKDKTVKTELLDGKLKRCSVEEVSLYKNDDGSRYQIKKVNDFRNNTVSKVRLDFDKHDVSYVTNEIRIVKDKDGNIIRKEYTSPSEVWGVFDIKHVDANGKETIISSGKRNPKTGVVTVKKEMESVDGTKTSYLYEDDPEGNRISDYKITDKNGKVLLNNSKTFEVVGENKFITSKNKEKYEIVVDDYNIKVTDVNNPNRFVNIPTNMKIIGEKQEMLQALKQMPGEELFKVAKSTNRLVGMKDDKQRESYYQPETKNIYAGSDLFVILHELGHAVDMKDSVVSYKYNGDIDLINTITKNKEVQQVYDKERKAFNKVFPEAQRNHIDYFINKGSHYNGELGGLTEAIAESNAILTTPKSFGPRTIRTQYLQQYFPRTIALLDKVLSESVK